MIPNQRPKPGSDCEHCHYLPDHENPHYIRHQERLIDHYDVLTADVRRYQEAIERMDSGDHPEYLPADGGPSLRAHCEKQIKKNLARMATLWDLIDFDVMAEWMIVNSVDAR
jgi:hypothetical protein